MTYLANAALRVNRDGADQVLRPGDPIPEAADWKHYTRHRYLATGLIKDVPDAGDPSGHIAALEARIAQLEAENAALVRRRSPARKET